MSRAPQLRSGRVLRFGPASLGTLMGSVAEKLKYSNVMERSTCRRGPLGIDFRFVRSVLNACFNVDTCASLAYGGRIYIPAACPVGPKLIGGRARTW